jgi:uncharacterized protein (DUF2147 family)
MSTRTVTAATLRWSALAVAAVLAAAAAPARAEGPTPVGRWTTVDDDTGKPKSVVRIWEENGKLQGSIESLILAPGEDPAPKCTKCEGERKDQPIVGMVILWGLARDGAEWSGGRILDPDNGSTYKCLMEPVEGGAKLKVRGYIGLSIIGRTQVWLKAD